MEATHGEKMKIISILLEKEIHAQMSKLLPNLTPKQTMVMLELFAQPDHRLVQKQLEHKLRTSHATTRGIIRRMSAARMVNTSPDPDDRRQVFVSLSSEGLELIRDRYQQVIKVFKETDEKMMQGVSAADQQVFDRVLDQIIKNL